MRSARHELVREEEFDGREPAAASPVAPMARDFGPSAVEALQRSAGNQAVARLIAERKLQRLGGDVDMVVEGGGGGGGGNNNDQSRKRKRKDGDKGEDAPPEKTIKREAMGDYVKDADYPKLDRWMHTSRKWHFSYFKESGDYHLK